MFTGTEALRDGWTHDGLRHAVAADRLERVRVNCYAPPAPVDLHRFAAADLRLARQAIAASLILRGASVSHLGSAYVQGLPIWAPSPRPCVTTAGTHTRVAGVHAHRSAVHVGHTGTIGGVAVTTPERTVVDIAREFGSEAALVVADAALRAGVMDRRVLADVIADIGRRSDVSAALEISALIDPRAESPLESRSRWHLTRLDLPAPESQMDIFTRDGVFVGRTDFYWDDGVVGEVDGTMKYAADGADRRPVLGREKWRQERLEDLELQVVRWGAYDLRDFRAKAVTLRRAFARARAQGGDRLWIAVPSGTWWS